MFGDNNESLPPGPPPITAKSYSFEASENPLTGMHLSAKAVALT